MRQYRLVNNRIVSFFIAVIMITLSVSGITFASERPTDKAEVVNSAPAVDQISGIDAVANLLKEGFFGRKWGSLPSRFESAMHMADLSGNIAVYAADIDMSPVLGEVQAFSSLRLVFVKENGLQKVYLTFDETDYAVVEKHLKRVLGAPSPIIYELWAVRMDDIERSEWYIGKDTRLVLAKRITGAVIEISRRNSMVPEGCELEKALVTAQIKQAKELERQNRMEEASSVYQDVLNGTGSYHEYTLTAQEHLAALSRRDGVTEYLFEDAGLVFRGLKNRFPVTTKQFWIRIDFGPKVQAELQKRMAAEMGQIEKIPTISAALCRLKPVKGQTFKLMEQVWLDDTDKIVGTRDAGMPQDVGCPAAYIKQVSEQFMEDWFFFGNIRHQG